MYRETGLILPVGPTVGHEKPEPVKFTNGRIPFPEIAANIATRHPQLKDFILEMAATNPAIFLHQVMVVETFKFMREEFVKSRLFKTDMHRLKNLDRILQSADTGALLHDCGKWIITRDLSTSVAITNSTASVFQNGNGSNTSRFDLRIYRLHSTAGGHAVRALKILNPSIPAGNLRWWAEIPFANHEHFVSEPVVNGDAKPVPSYPRNTPRINYAHEELAGNGKNAGHSRKHFVVYQNNGN